VFTLPAAVAALAAGNRRRLYGLLFEAAAAAVREVAADRRHLGAAVGLLLVLDTWGRTCTTTRSARHRHRRRPIL
jgi:hypothetical protein